MQLTQEEVKWLFDTLRAIEYFSFCTVGEIEDFIEIAKKEEYRKGKKIVQQGEVGGFFFIIKEGKISIWAKDEHSGKQKIATLNPGDFFGETALIERKPRNATAITETNCKLFVLYGETLIGILDKNPYLREHFHRIANKRDAERKLILSRPKKGFFQRLVGS